MARKQRNDDPIVEGEYTLDDATPSSALVRRSPLARQQRRSQQALARYEALADRAREYAKNSRSPNTFKAYHSDWREFERWCDEFEIAIPYSDEPVADGEIRRLLEPASPEIIGRYIAYLADEKHRKLTTIERRLSSISQIHQLQKLPSPTQTEHVRTVMKGIRRDPTTNKHSAAKAAIELEHLRRLLDKIDNHRYKLHASRDRALLLLMFAGALRRSEAHGLDREHVKFVERKGMIITLPQSKTSQEEAVEITIKNGKHKETCPVRNLQQWIKDARITSGAIFRQGRKGGMILDDRLSDRAIAEIIKRWCAAAGMDPDEFGGHSLRAGFVTEADKRGISERIGMNHTRHKTIKVYRGYSRGNRRWEDSPTEQLGL